MRFPAQPPDIADTFKDPRNVFKIVGAAEDEAARSDRYLHWDELRHRKPPPGLTVEEWWAGLKMRRLAHRQALPILDKKGRPFTFSLTPRMFEWLHHIDLKCGGSVEGPEAVTHPDTRDRYYISSLVEEAITSSQLEGAVVTRSVAKEMLRTGRNPVDPGERMILNNFLTMRKLSEWKDRELTPELVLEIHRTIAHGTMEKPEQEGCLRSEADDVRVEDDLTGEVMHTPPPAGALPDRLRALCDFANDSEMRGFLHPVIRSIVLHFWLAYDHPFVDGNGRTARALFYWSMLRHRFWLFEFVSISQQLLEAPVKYYRAFLHTETDENDLNYFLLHQLSVIGKAIDHLHEYIARKSGELVEARTLLNGVPGLNHRQLALLRHALKHPGAVFTVTSHQNSHAVVTQTARADLTNLVDRDLLRKFKQGKAFVFVPVEGLTEILRERRT